MKFHTSGRSGQPWKALAYPRTSARSERRRLLLLSDIPIEGSTDGQSAPASRRHYNNNVNHGVRPLSSSLAMQTTAMSHATNGSSTSLDKMADKADHMEDGGAGGLPSRPEALKDMSDADLLVLEKRMVRKMDSIIL
jgi:hypothetical protein